MAHYTQDIAEWLVNLTYGGGDASAATIEAITADIEAALYHIAAIASNERNKDYWRVLLSTLADAMHGDAMPLF